MQNLQRIFIFMSVLALLILGYNLYSTRHFDHNPLPKTQLQKIQKKATQLNALAQNYFNLQTPIKITISDKMPNQIYGLAANGNPIQIYLNKNHFKESASYMIHDVLPHEYAHAIIFALGLPVNRNGGHTKAWQKACKVLGGINCTRFASHTAIAKDKIRFW